MRYRLRSWRRLILIGIWVEPADTCSGDPPQRCGVLAIACAQACLVSLAKLARRFDWTRTLRSWSLFSSSSIIVVIWGEINSTALPGDWRDAILVAALTIMMPIFHRLSRGDLSLEKHLTLISTCFPQCFARKLRHDAKRFFTQIICTTVAVVLLSPSSMSRPQRNKLTTMPFVFSRFFYLLILLGLIPLSLSWGRPWLRWATLAYDLVLISLAIIDGRRSPLPKGIRITREFDGRFAVGAETDVQIKLQNATPRPITLRIKDEYPPQMKLIGTREAIRACCRPNRSPVGLWIESTETWPVRIWSDSGALSFARSLAWCQTLVGEPTAVKVYPNLRRAREAELKALGARSLVAAHRKTSWRGEGREFESLREYVRGDELRHISWTATARRGKLTTRQYQIERDQTILIALDAGRLMTARIDQETSSTPRCMLPWRSCQRQRAAETTRD